ncbi:hypothetical protein ACFVWT_11865 [Arthrobacter sp. NPDC058288]|uniref:hypothetical protein n=1 Tax=Arthrobacter sp. NPDC058288 TaxID=3346424 RepID=UPI0036E7ABAA
MTGTHRALNRALLALTGLLLIAAGALAAAAGTLPGAAAEWAATGRESWGRIRELLAAAPLPDGTTSWWTIAAVGGLLLGTALMTGWAASQGGGRTRIVAETPDAGQGTTTVETGLVSRLVAEALAGNRLVLSTSVSAWRVRGPAGKESAIKIRIQARQGACPRELADTAEQLIAGLDRMLGHPVPVLVRITAGTRTRPAPPDRAH